MFRKSFQLWPRHFSSLRQLRRRKWQVPSRGFVRKRTKTLALLFFFNEAFRFDARTYPDRKHQSAPGLSLEIFGKPTGRSGVFAARLPAILMAAAFRALFARRTKCL